MSRKSFWEKSWRNYSFKSPLSDPSFTYLLSPFPLPLSISPLLRTAPYRPRASFGGVLNSCAFRGTADPFHAAAPPAVPVPRFRCWIVSHVPRGFASSVLSRTSCRDDVRAGHVLYALKSRLSCVTCLTLWKKRDRKKNWKIHSLNYQILRPLKFFGNILLSLFFVTDNAKDGPFSFFF